MPRLIDRIMNDGYLLPYWWPHETRLTHGDKAGLDKFGKLLQEAAANPIIVADDVVRWHYEGTDQEVWRWDEHFPNLVPPYETMWVETRAPERIVSEESGVTPWQSHGNPRPKSWGLLLRRADRPEGGFRVHGVLAMTIPVPDKAVVAPVCEFDMFLDEHGAIDANPALDGKKGPAYGIGPMGNISHEKADELVGELSGYVRALMLSIVFMHCKNVDTVQEAPPAALNKKWQRKHGRPLYSYRVVKVEPVRRVLREHGDMDNIGPQRALHICRGHFARYTAEAPLFGRVVGTFWRQEHLRGSPEVGVAEKDYRPQARREQP